MLLEGQVGEIVHAHHPVTASAHEQVFGGFGRGAQIDRVRVDQAPPKACGQSFDGEASLGSEDATGFVGKLIADKGYEVIVLDEVRFADWLAPSGHGAFGDELVARLREPGDGGAGPLTRTLLERLREEDRVDGLLVLGTELTCLNANAVLRSLYSIGTLGLHAISPSQDWQQTYPVHRVLVFETTTVRVVWRNEWNSFSQAADYFKNMTSSGGGPLPIESLLEPLEPAVPKVLTR